MREIKFRALDTCFNKSLIRYDIKDISYRKDGVWINYANNDVVRVSDKNPLMQFTGLHDKNGKEIYEGDIVMLLEEDEDSCCGRIIKTQCVVCFGGGEYPYSFTLKNNIFYKGYRIFGFIYHNDDMEVIGNIHENPELLEYTK